MPYCADLQDTRFLAHVLLAVSNHCCVEPASAMDFVTA